MCEEINMAGVLLILTFVGLTQADLSEPRTLKAEYGVNFRHIGRIQPALDRRYLTFDIQLPNYRSAFNDLNFQLNCHPNVSTVNNKHNAYKALEKNCEEFQWLLDNHRLDVIMKDGAILDEIDKIKQVLPLKELSNNDRQKRGLPMAFMFGIASGVASIINTVTMRRKISMLENSVKILEKNNFRLEGEFLDMHKDMISIAQITSQKFDMMGKAINATNKALIKHTDSIRKEMYKSMSNLQNHILKVLVDLAEIQASLTAKAIQYTKLIDTHYTKMNWYLEAYRSGVVDLMQGKIPTSLIPPDLLQRFLDKAKADIYRDNPNYELVFPSVAHYYRKMDIVYTVKKNHLVVVIPLLLKKVNQDPLELYKIENCFVPFQINNGTQDKAGSYTKVKIPTDYLAVNGPNFVEITQSQLEMCTDYNDLYLCEEYLLQIDQNSHTCSSALFWDAPAKVIIKYCEFTYKFEIRPPPCILESEDKILLTNLGTKWTFRCEDENVPKRILGSNFAVVDRELFCGCALIGQTFFIPQRLENCKDKPEHLKLLFPVNAAVAALFGQQFDNDMLKVNFSALHLTPQDMNIPTLDVSLFPKDDDVLISQDLSQDIDLKRIIQALTDKRKVYLDRPEKTRQNNKIENWFKDLDNVALSVMFVLSIVGTLAALIGIVNCVRTNKAMALFGSLMAMPSRTRAWNLFEEEKQVEYLNMFYDNLFQVVLFLGFYLCYRMMVKIYSQWSLIKILAPNTIATNQGTISHIHLEFGVPTEKPCKIYLCSIYTSIMDLTIIGVVRFEELRLKAARCKTHAVLKLEWAKALFCLKCNGEMVRLPSMAYVSIYTYLAMKRIMHDNYTLRILITYDGLTYVLHSEGSREESTMPRMIHDKSNKRLAKHRNRLSLDRSDIQELAERDEDSVIKTNVIEVPQTPGFTPRLHIPGPPKPKRLLGPKRNINIPENFDDGYLQMDVNSSSEASASSCTSRVPNRTLNDMFPSIYTEMT